MRNCAGGLAASVVAVLVLFAVAPAMARTPSACDGDVEKLCHGVEPGGGRVFSCLHTHASELSPDCKQALREVKQAPGKHRWLSSSSAWAGVCSGDVATLCKDIPSGAGRIAECLKQHEASLSPACKAAFAPTPAK